MARQINPICNFVLGYLKCELPEDMVDVEVRIRTFKGTHTLKEGREYFTLKFRPWGGQVKPFEVLKVKLSRYIKRRETITAAATASVAPIFKKAQEEEEKREYTKQQQAQSPKDTEKGQENVSDISNSASQVKDEQLSPKVWMGAQMLNDQNHKIKETVGKYCDVCIPNGSICPR